MILNLSNLIIKVFIVSGKIIKDIKFIKSMILEMNKEPSPK